MVTARERFCPTELAEGLSRVYERFSGKFDFDGLTDKTAEARRKELGWEVFGGFTCVFMDFLEKCRAVGHRRVNYEEVFSLLVAANAGKSVATAKKIMGRVNALLVAEISLYSQDLLARFANHPCLGDLHQAFDRSDWEAVGHWLFAAREYKELERFMDLVPAFDWGFFK